MPDTLDMAIEATHDVLEERLSAAAIGVAPGNGPRDVQQLTDTFLVSTCRHMTAVNTVLLPAARSLLPDGRARAREFTRACRRLERSLAQTKAKLYGSAYAIHRPWAGVWADVRTAFADAVRVEREIVAALGSVTDAATRDDLAARMYRAELAAPTRPHPYLPHHGLAGRLTRRLWSWADRFWDAAEGRLAPEPVRVRRHARDGLLTQYLLGSPRMGADRAPDVT